MTPKPSNTTSRLSARRHELGMSYPALAERSGVSEPTVKRILSGQDASFANVTAVAAAMGLKLGFEETDAQDLRRAQAEKKARHIARMVQGTSALESQAVDDATYQRLVEKSLHELLAGSSRRLWAN